MPAVSASALFAGGRHWQPVRNGPAKGRSTAESGKRPNILFILADDLGYADLGVFGSEIPTPNLDALAKAGLLLTDFYSAMTCSPTRAMLMSGTDHHLAGLGVMGRPTREDQKGQPGYEGFLNFRVASLADLMTDAGYNTYMTGKWHLGDEVETGPRARGLQALVRLARWRGASRRLGLARPEARQVPRWRRARATWATTSTPRASTRRRMIEYIEQDRAEGKPFFAYSPTPRRIGRCRRRRNRSRSSRAGTTQATKPCTRSVSQRRKQLGLVPPDCAPIDDARFKPRWSALTAEEKQIESRRMEIYAAMVSDLDTYVGEVVAYLKKIGEFDNTLIMFMSDNGAEPDRRDLKPPIADQIGKAYDHSLDNLGSATSYVMYGPNWASASATPFNRHKFTGFEGGVHVPAFVHFPKKVAAGTRSDAMGTVMDLLPTFLAMAGTQHPGATYRGKAVLQPRGRVAAAGASTARQKYVHAADEILGWELFGHRSVRQGDWKLVWDNALPEKARRWYLYDLRTDLSEQKDLSVDNPEQLQKMLQHWERFDQESGVIY